MRISGYTGTLEYGDVGPSVEICIEGSVGPYVDFVSDIFHGRRPSAFFFTIPTICGPLAQLRQEVEASGLEFILSDVRVRGLFRELLNVMDIEHTADRSALICADAMIFDRDLSAEEVEAFVVGALSEETANWLAKRCGSSEKIATVLMASNLLSKESTQMLWLLHSDILFDKKAIASRLITNIPLFTMIFRQKPIEVIKRASSLPISALSRDELSEAVRGNIDSQSVLKNWFLLAPYVDDATRMAVARFVIETDPDQIPRLLGGAPIALPDDLFLRLQGYIVEKWGENREAFGMMAGQLFGFTNDQSMLADEIFESILSGRTQTTAFPKLSANSIKRIIKDGNGARLPLLLTNENIMADPRLLELLVDGLRGDGSAPMIRDINLSIFNGGLPLQLKEKLAQLLAPEKAADAVILGCNDALVREKLIQAASTHQTSALRCLKTAELSAEEKEILYKVLLKSVYTTYELLKEPLPEVIKKKAITKVLSSSEMGWPFLEMFFDGLPTNLREFVARKVGSKLVIAASKVLSVKWDSANYTHLIPCYGYCFPPRIIKTLSVADIKSVIEKQVQTRDVHFLQDVSFWNEDLIQHAIVTVSQVTPNTLERRLFEALMSTRRQDLVSVVSKDRSLDSGMFEFVTDKVHSESSVRRYRGDLDGSLAIFRFCKDRLAPPVRKELVRVIAENLASCGTSTIGDVLKGSEFEDYDSSVVVNYFANTNPSLISRQFLEHFVSTPDTLLNLALAAAAISGKAQLVQFLSGLIAFASSKNWQIEMLFELAFGQCTYADAVRINLPKEYRARFIKANAVDDWQTISVPPEDQCGVLSIVLPDLIRRRMIYAGIKIGNLVPSIDAWELILPYLKIDMFDGHIADGALLIKSPTQVQKKIIEYAIQASRPAVLVDAIQKCGVSVVAEFAKEQRTLPEWWYELLVKKLDDPELIYRYLPQSVADAAFNVLGFTIDILGDELVVFGGKKEIGKIGRDGKLNSNIGLGPQTRSKIEQEGLIYLLPTEFSAELNPCTKELSKLDSSLAKALKSANYQIGLIDQKLRDLEKAADPSQVSVPVIIKRKGRVLYARIG
jgi:hypothetical protein